MSETQRRGAVAAVTLAVGGASCAGVDPVRDGLLPCGYGTRLSRVFSIELLSRSTPAGVTFGRGGRSLAVGDVDGDGVDDLAMGFAECVFGDCGVSSGAQRVGVVRVYSGATGGVIVEVVGRGWSGPAQIDGFGWSVALADVTGDGRADLVVGAPMSGGSRGRVDVFSSGGDHLYTVDGPEGAERFGELVLTLGDASRDGRDDFLVLDSAALGRAPTVWSMRGVDGSLMHSRVVLSHRVTVLGDRNGDGVPEYACGAPNLPVPQERARAFRGDTGAIAYQLLAAEGFLAWLGDVDGDGFAEFVQFNSLFEWRGPNQYVQEGPLGLPSFPLPRLTLGSADLDGDGALDAMTVLGAVVDVPDLEGDALALTSARAGETYGLFLARHRALVDDEWLAHDFRRVATGRLDSGAEGGGPEDLVIELVAGARADDAFLAGVYAGPWLPGDVNHDGVVNFADLNAVLSRLGESAAKDALGDADCSGVIDWSDLRRVVEFYGTTAPAPRHTGVRNPSHR